MTKLLLSPAFPYLLAGLVLLVGLALVWRGRRASGLRRWAGLGLGSLVALAGVALGAGALAMTGSARQIEAARPAGGKLVEVDGERLFLLCEGPRTGPTLLLISGAYSSGWFMAPLHEALRTRHRSCLVDRPGTGWAEPARSPRTVDRVVTELVEGVTRAGETGPIIPVGHSVGGLYAANLAQAYPGRVRAAVLLDPTPPSWFVEQQGLWGCGPSRPGGLAFWASMFGLGLVPSLNPMNADHPDSPKAALGALYPMLVRLESRPRALAAQREALATTCRDGLGLARLPGALGDLPLLMIVQDQAPAQIAAQMPPGLSARQQANWRLLRAQWTRDYVGFTTRGELAKAPAGAGHQFPLTRLPETVARIEQYLAGLDAPAGPAPATTPVNP